MNGGRFDFDDGGTYCGGWEDGKAHGHGVCTGPKGQGEYSGAWHYGFEVSGVYAWPSGNTYEGQWQNGKRHGLGIERRGRWVYRGEWTQGYKGRYGVRHSTSSNARYTGTWANGLQDGYGTENYADGGTYQGQWLRGMRHGYGVRKSAPFSIAAKYRSRSHAHASLTSLRSNQDVEEEEEEKDKNKASDENRGGFVLRARSEPPVRRRSLSERSIAVKRTILQGLRIKKQKSTGDIVQRIASGGTGSIRSSGSTVSWGSDESAWTGYNSAGGHQEHESLLYLEFVDPNSTELYMGEWKNDKRSGFGICERSDGLKYEGEWYNNKKFGYGVTTFKDGTREEGKYKNNVLLTSQRKKHLLFVRSSKLRERVDSAVAASNRAAQIAGQKAEIALARTGTAEDRAEQADLAALQAQEDSDIARLCAKQFAPDFHQPGTEILKKYRQEMVTTNFVSPTPTGRRMSPHSRGHRSLSLLPRAPTAAPPAATHKEEEAVEQHRRSGADTSNATAQTVNSSQPGAGDALQSPTADYHDAVVDWPPRDREEVEEEAASPAINNELCTPEAKLSRASRPVIKANASEAEWSADDHKTPPTKGAVQKWWPSGRPEDAMGSGEKAVRTLRPLDESTPGGCSAVLANRTLSHSGSKHSLNQIMNDYFDQYTIAANPKAAKLYEANFYKSQSASNRAADATAHSELLMRRSTFSAAKDVRVEPDASGSRAKYPFSSIAEGDAQPAMQQQQQQPMIATGNGQEEIASGTVLNSDVTYGQFEMRGSLPDLIHLDDSPVVLTREEIARLSSQRRQELLRDRKKVELIRQNPLRLFLLLFHPQVKNWIWRWKLPLFILFTNLALSFVFCHLLMNDKADPNGS